MLTISYLNLYIFTWSDAGDGDRAFHACETYKG